ncbi:MAG: CdaR family protein [Lentisphaeria bacterium]
MKILPDFMKRDWLRKLTALFFAILIWYMVDLQLHEFGSFREVPVQIITDSNFVVLNPGTQFVNVKLRGPQSRLKVVGTQDIVIEVYVKSPNKLGSMDVAILPSNITLPHGVSVDDITPSNVKVEIDQLVTKKVKVNVVTSGKLSEGYREIDRNRVIEPLTVNLRGPSNFLSNIDSIQTETEFFDDKVTASYRKTLPLVYPIANLSSTPSDVIVSFTIEELMGEKLFLELPISIIGNDTPKKVKLKNNLPKMNQVTLHGPKEILANLTTNDIKAFVDISSIITAGTSELSVGVWVNNPQISVLFQSPKVLDLEFEYDIIE